MFLGRGGWGGGWTNLALSTALTIVVRAAEVQAALVTSKAQRYGESRQLEVLREAGGGLTQHPWHAFTVVVKAAAGEGMLGGGALVTEIDLQK